VSAICPIIRSSFADYAADALPAPQRRILRDHLAACPDCRALAAGQDATLLFARPFPAEELPAGDALRILGNVRTAVAFAQTEARIRRTSRRRATLSSAAAAAALAALIVLAPSSGARRPPAIAVARPTPSAETVALQPALPAEWEGTSADATVYDWNPGAGREEPRVVWIVDRGLDI
jgi:putative zinc finger protein